MTGNNYTGGCSPEPCSITGSYYSTGLISTYAGWFVGSTICYGCPVEAIVNAPLGGTAWNLFITGCGVSAAVQGGGQGYFTWTGSQYDSSYYCNQQNPSGPPITGTKFPVHPPTSARYVDPLNYGRGFNKTT